MRLTGLQAHQVLRGWIFRFRLECGEGGGVAPQDQSESVVVFVCMWSGLVSLCACGQDYKLLQCLKETVATPDTKQFTVITI